MHIRVKNQIKEENLENNTMQIVPRQNHCQLETITISLDHKHFSTKQPELG